MPTSADFLGKGAHFRFAAGSTCEERNKCREASSCPVSRETPLMSSRWRAACSRTRACSMPSATSACAIPATPAASCCRARARRSWSSRRTFSNTRSMPSRCGRRRKRLFAERVIHGCIYQARPDVMAVCHHHAAAVLPFCIAGVPIVPVFHLGAATGAPIPFWDQQDEFGDTNLLVAKPEEGRSLARALGAHAGGADEPSRRHRGGRRPAASWSRARSSCARTRSISCRRICSARSCR